MLLDRLRDRALDRGPVGHVRLELQAGRVVVEAEVDDRDLRALRLEALRRRLADPPAAAGDERDLALEAIHAA